MTTESLTAPADPDDYARVARAIRFISEGPARPSAGRVAAEMGLDERRAAALFRRWAGLTPADFHAAVALDRAKSLLVDEASVLEASLGAGLSGPGRLHDLFITHTAMPPGVWKAKGAGLSLVWGAHPTPFGLGLFALTPHGLAGIGFAEDAADINRAADDLIGRWPNAEARRDDAAVAATARRVFDPREWRQDAPLRVVLIGTDFEIRVWEALIDLRRGEAPGRSYGALAAAVGRPKAARAVGRAVGRNPISFVVPCHRIVGANGALTGYHWGLTRKRAMLGWETGLNAR